MIKHYALLQATHSQNPMPDRHQQRNYSPAKTSQVKELPTKRFKVVENSTSREQISG
jgi:hypothetical protein